MKVLAPWWIEYADNEDEEFFIAFAWLVAKDEGFNSAYYIHVGDVSTFFANHTHTYIGNVRELRSVKRWLTFGKVAKNMFRFHFNKADYKEIEWELKNPKLIAMWLYILAKREDGQLMHEHHLGVHQRWRKNVLPKEVLEWLRDR